MAGAVHAGANSTFCQCPKYNKTAGVVFMMIHSNKDNSYLVFLFFKTPINRVIMDNIALVNRFYQAFSENDGKRWQTLWWKCYVSRRCIWKAKCSRGKGHVANAHCKEQGSGSDLDGARGFRGIHNHPLDGSIQFWTLVNVRLSMK